jgi:effector-binding domain-containing protein
MIFLVIFQATTVCGADFRKLQVSVKEMAPFRYMCYEHIGQYREFPYAETAFLTEFRGSAVKPLGHQLALYWNSPLKVKPEDLRYDVGFPVAPNQLPVGNLKVKDFLYTRAASTIHVGSYNDTYQTTNALYQWIAFNGYRIIGGPCVEIYYDDNPQEVPDERKRTEILIPIQ